MKARGILAAILAALTLVRVTAVWAQDPISEALEREFQIIMDILISIKDWFITLGRVLSGVLIVVGVVLWASDIFSYKGKRLITSGVVLFFILELLR